MEHNGKTIFITDPQFRYTPPGIPTVKNSKQLDDQKSASVIIGGNASNSSSSGSINWSTIIIIGVVVLILAAAGFGIYYYTKMQPTPEAPVTKIDTTTVKDTTATPIPISVDSSILKAQNDSLNALKADSMTANQFKFVIGTYAALDRALNRYNKLKLAGTNVELATRDSLTYYVLTIIDCKPVDTTLTKDSLQRFYGYRPVTIYGQ